MAMGDPNAPDVTELRKNKLALPKVLPKPISRERGPLQVGYGEGMIDPGLMAARQNALRDKMLAEERANETSSAMQGANYNETPAAPLQRTPTLYDGPSPAQQATDANLEKYKQMRETGKSAAQLATEANLEKYRRERMGEQPNTFAAFLKSLGLGK